MDTLGFLKGLKSQIEYAISQIETQAGPVGVAAVTTTKRKRRMSPEARAAAGLRLESYRAAKAGQTVAEYRKARQAAKDALAKGATQTKPQVASAAKA